MVAREFAALSGEILDYLQSIPGQFNNESSKK